jgi:creatinine amidohydrolase
MPETEWARLKAHELRALAAEGAAVILPLASIEQHGPHLPVMTDTRLGLEIARRAAEKAWPTRKAVVAPVVWSGLSEHHMPFGGTLTVSAATFAALVGDLIAAMARHGFRDVLLSNSHGGNMIAMRAIADEIGARGDVTVVAATYVQEAAGAFAKILEDQSGVQHACEAETSMMLALEAGLVDASDLGSLGTDPDAPYLGAGAAAHRWRSFASVTADGVLGRPAKASAEKGERLLEAGAEAIAALLTDPAVWAAAQDRRGAGTAGVPFGNR